MATRNIPPETIPFLAFGESGQPLHFGHANGYPPEGYKTLLSSLAATYRVFAMRMRPLWSGANPRQVKDWRILADDLAVFLDQQEICTAISAGHSMGATTALRLALRQPERFNGLVLIDPVLFRPARILLMWLIHGLGLSYQLHPLVKSALHRRSVFEARQAMFDNYRKKAVFNRIDDQELWHYVEALALPRADHQFELAYTPEWEARIYVTGLLADLHIWRQLSTLKPPLLVIRGALSNTFQEKTAQEILRRLPEAEILSIPDATHLVPLEKPRLVFELISQWLSNHRLESAVSI